MIFIGIRKPIALRAIAFALSLSWITATLSHASLEGLEPRLREVQPKQSLQVAIKTYDESLFSQLEQACQVNSNENTEACVLEKLLVELKRQIPADYPETVSLEQYYSLRNFLHQVYASALNLKPQHLKLTLESLRQLIEEIAPFDRVADGSVMTERLLEIFTGSERVSDIRDLALISDFILDPRVQEKVNQFIVSSDFKKVVKQNSILANKRQGEISWAKAELMGISYLGTKIKNLYQTRRSSFAKSTQAPEEFLANHQKFSAHEAWLMTHEVRHSHARSILLARGEEARLRSLREALEEYQRATKNPHILATEYGKIWETGDIVLTSIERAKHYADKRKQSYLDRIQFFTRADAAHAGMIVKTDTDVKILQLGGGGVSFQEIVPQEGYQNYGYRIHLEHFLTDEFKRFFSGLAEAQGLTLHEFLVIKRRQYSPDYEKNALREVAGTYLFTEVPPKYWIKNTGRRNGNSVINPLNWFPSLKKKPLKEKVAEIREKGVFSKHLAQLQEFREIAAELSAKKVAELEKIFESNRGVEAGDHSEDDPEEIRKSIASFQETLRDLDEAIDAVHEPSSINKATIEICSEFTLKEWVRYVSFFENKLREEFRSELEQARLDPNPEIFHIPFGDRLKMSGFHPGKLARLLSKLEKKGIATRIAIPSLFQ